MAIDIVVEVKKRKCCSQEDLKLYQGLDKPKQGDIYFCKHCGQLGHYYTLFDAYGCPEYYFKPIHLDLSTYGHSKF